MCHSGTCATTNSSTTLLLREPCQATTASSGSCLNAPPAPGSAVRVGNREHVHRTRSFGPYQQAREIDLGDVALQRGAQVTLSVVDRRGEPVGGIRVVAREPHSEGRHDMLMVDTGFPWRSDAHGAIELPYALRPGHYHIAWYP